MDYLALRGQKVYSDKTLKSYTKDQLIEQIRILEHNYNGEIWGRELLTKRLEKASNYLKEQGLSLEEINKIFALIGENI